VGNAEDVIKEAAACFTSDLPNLLDELGELLPIYAGIPSRIDVFSILNLSTDEDRHTECLRWLLDPGENHGFGDALLRRFLLRTDHDDAIAHALSDRSIAAEVRTQVDVPTFGVPDLVVVLRTKPQCIVVVEAKINAPLTNKRDEPQTRRYRRAAVKRHLQRACGLDCEPSSVSFVFLPMHLGQSPEDDITDVDNGVRRFVTVLQRTVAADCLEVLHETDTDPSVVTLVRAFCTSVLRASNGGAAYDALLSLRRVNAEATATAGRRRTSALSLTRLINANVQELRGEMADELSNTALKELIAKNYETVSLLVREFESVRTSAITAIKDSVTNSSQHAALQDTVTRCEQKFENYDEGDNGHRFGVRSLGGVSFFLEPSTSGGLRVRVKLRFSQKELNTKELRNARFDAVTSDPFSAADLKNNKESEIVEAATSLEDAKTKAIALVAAGLNVLDQVTALVYPRSDVGPTSAPESPRSAE
jgi:hypothetical protein